MEQALQRERAGVAAPQNASLSATNLLSTSSPSSAALASSYPRALLDLALACFASGGIGASKIRAEGVEALSKWCCVTAESAAAAASGAAQFPAPPPPGAVSVSALDEHLRARAAALSSASSSSSSSSAACRDAWMALGCLRGLRAASGKGGGGKRPTDGNDDLSATAAADAFAAAAAAASVGGGPDSGDDSVALAALGRALLSAGRAGHAVAALEKAAARSGSPATWMLLGRARGQALPMTSWSGSGDGGAGHAVGSSLAAAAAFARAAQLAPDAPAPWEALAVALTAAGREDLAADADSRRMPAAELLRSLAAAGGGGAGGNRSGVAAVVGAG